MARSPYPTSPATTTESRRSRPSPTALPTPSWAISTPTYIWTGPPSSRRRSRACSWTSIDGATTSSTRDGEVRSRRGVVRTHTMRDAPIFARPLALADLAERLRTLYDPYYATLERLLTEIRQAYGYALLLDGHTGSPRRMKADQVNIRPRHDETCATEPPA